MKKIVKVLMCLALVIILSQSVFCKEIHLTMNETLRRLEDMIAKGAQPGDIIFSPTSGVAVFALHPKAPSLTSGNDTVNLDLSPYILNLTTTGAKADGIRTELNMGYTNIIIGNDLSIYTSGVSADGINLAGEWRMNLIIGDNARIETEASATWKNSLLEDEGAHAVRANTTAPSLGGSHDRQYIKIGKNSEIITNGDNSFALLAGLGPKSLEGKIGDWQFKSIIEIGDNAIIKTAGKEAYGVYANTPVSEITLGNNLKVITDFKKHGGENSTALFALNGGKITLLGSVDISVNAESANSIHAGREAVIASSDFDNDVSLKSDNIFKINGKIHVDKERLNFSPTVLANPDYKFVAFDNIGGVVKLRMGANSIIERSDWEIAQNKYVLYAENTTVPAIEELNNPADALIHIKAFGSTSIIGDIGAFYGGKIILDLYDSSQIRGAAAGGDVGAGGATLNLIGEHTIWNVEKIAGTSYLSNTQYASALENLNMSAGSKVVFGSGIYDSVLSKADYFQLDINNLTGTGRFDMRVDLSIPTLINDKKSDFIWANNASGNYVIGVTLVKNIVGVERLQLAEILIPDSDLNFRLYTADNKLIFGSYVYKLVSENIKKEWWLVLDHISDELENDPIDAIFGLFEFAKAIDASLSDDFLRPRNDWWFITIGKDQLYDKSMLKSTMEQQIGGAIVGKDNVYSDYLNAGIFTGSNVGYQQIGEVGSVGHILDILVGTYVNYARWGLDASAYVRGDYYRHNLRILSQADDMINTTISTYGFSVSVEALYKFGLFKDLFYIGPKAKATFTYVANKPYDFGNGNIMDVYFEKGLVSWIGVRIGREQYNAYDKKWGCYIEAGWIHDTNPTLIAYSAGEPDTEIRTEIGKNRYEVGTGVELAPFGKGTFLFEVKCAWGLGIVEPIKLKIAGSWKF